MYLAHCLQKGAVVSSGLIIVKDIFSVTNRTNNINSHHRITIFDLVVLRSFVLEVL